MLALLPFLFAVFPLTLARKISVKNSCQSTIWPGMFTGVGSAPDQPTGWELTAGQTTTFDVPDGWTAGRIWARTGCVTQDGKFQCLTGNCQPGHGGDKTCANPDEPPATLAEFTLIPGGEDNYDISLVDGFNIPLNIKPSISSCPNPKCEGNINAMCPPLLRTGIDQDGNNLACLHPCNAGFGQELYGNRVCCTGSYNDPTMCAICGVDYYAVFKENCEQAYAYAYDEKSKTALWTCSTAHGMADYEVEFCPNGSDYVGPSVPSEKYLDATATCTSKATFGSQTFSVGPSPTKTATKGTLLVVATAATGLDGAAALATGAISGTGPSPADDTSTLLTTVTKTATATATAADGVITNTVAVVSGSALLEIVDGSKANESADDSTPPASGGGVHHYDEHCRGGQWLQAVPEHGTRKRRVRRSLR